MKGDEMGKMSKDFQLPSGSYAEKQDQMPTSYIERNNRRQGAEASKVRKQAYKGKYS